MDTKQAKERKALQEKWVDLEKYLKDNGFVWESRFERPGLYADTYVIRPMVVKLCWEHKPKNNW
jgi:hypothetical protein